MTSEIDDLKGMTEAEALEVQLNDALLSIKIIQGGIQCRDHEIAEKDKTIKELYKIAFVAMVLGGLVGFIIGYHV